jgi:hypothetical protein
MQVHRQTCQQCGSIDVRNIIAREAGRATTIYVRCTECRELVASYQLADYYHHGKGIESYLRNHGVGAGDSGRQWLAEFDQIKHKAIEEFEEVLRVLAEQNKEV